MSPAIRYIPQSKIRPSVSPVYRASEFPKWVQLIENAPRGVVFASAIALTSVISAIALF
jgi:hypothetical protein